MPEARVVRRKTHAEWRIVGNAACRAGRRHLWCSYWVMHRDACGVVRCGCDGVEEKRFELFQMREGAGARAGNES